MLHPANSSAAAPAENDLLWAPGRQVSHQLPPPKADFLLTQLPKAPTFKSEKEKEPPSQTPPPAPEKSVKPPSPSTTPKSAASMPRNNDTTYYVNGKGALAHFSALWAQITGNLITWGNNIYGTNLATVVAGIGSTPATLMVPPGTYTLAADLTCPSTLALDVKQGATISIGTTALTGTLSCAYTPGAGTITVTSGNTKVAISEAQKAFRPTPGDIIKTAGGNYYTVRHPGDGYGNFFIYESPGATEKSAAYAVSAQLITGKGTAFTSEVKVGDYLYVAGQTLVVSAVVNDTSLWVYEPPTATFTGQSATRSLRLNINGDFQAGNNNYACFSGNGVVKFSPRTVYPEWWGATRDGDSGNSAANSTAIRKAIYSGLPVTTGGAALPPSMSVHLSRGVYVIRSPIPLIGGLSLSGEGTSSWGSPATWVRIDGAHFVGRAALIDAPGSTRYSSGIAIGNYGWLMENFVIDCGSATFGTAYIDCVNLSHSGYAEIKHMGFTNSSGWAVQGRLSGAMKIHDNWIATHYGIAIGWDSYCYNNDISFGGNAAGSAKITSTGWSTGEGAYRHTPGNVDPLIFSYDGKKVPLLKETDCYVLKWTVTGESRGTYILKYARGTITGASLGNGTFYALVTTNNISPPDFRWAPSSEYNGTISAVSFYHGVGIAIAGLGNTVTGNMVYGDPGGAVACLFDSGCAILSNNRLGPAGFGVSFGGWSFGWATCVNDTVISNFCVGYAFHNPGRDITIDGGIIYQNIMAAFGSARNYSPINLNGAVIRNVRITSDNGSIIATTPLNPLGFVTNPAHPGLMENNPGVDIGVDFPSLEANSATPDVTLGRNWKTANSKPTTVTDFTGGCKGKEIFVILGDAQTTLMFSGPSRLKGHGGVDWRPAVGDHLRAVKGDDGFWYCECFASNK